MSAREMLDRERERKRRKVRKRRERQQRHMAQAQQRVLRLPEVKRKVGLGHASIYAGIAEGTFPAPVAIGRRAVAWVEHEIDGWIEARIAERDSGTAVVRSLPLAQHRKIEASPRKPSVP
jgi:prophage regulatory protein